MSVTETADSVAAFCSAAQANDIDGMACALAPDAELISPLSGRMVFRGHDDLRVLLGAAFGSLRDLRWREFAGKDQLHVAVSEARVAGLGINDAMVIELDDDGRIRRIRPHLRPWAPLTVFALQLGLKLARHPGLIRRALQQNQ
ncbi:nuclear transport factor 2 family protein [Mycobacterium sp. 050272]|uniref:nuclear transport factor 2 family protein n=1 Tax=Mycobacteriaceae TaxID=1762 RepID=UPI0031890603